MSISNVIKSVQDIIRQDAGVDGDAQRISQLVWMIFLKVFDAKEEEWEIEEDNYKSIIPEEYRWRNWAVDNKDGKAMTGDELSNFIINLFNALKEIEINETTPIRGRIVREVFEDYYNDEESGQVVAFGGKLNVRPAYQREFVYDDKKIFEKSKACRVNI